MNTLFTLSSMSLILFSFSLVAAPCCGSSTTAPSIILGEDYLQLNSGYAYSWIRSEAAPNGMIRPRGETDHDVSQKITLTGSLLLTQNTQVGFSIPMVHRSRTRSGGERTAFGLADISGNFGWEFTPKAPGLMGLRKGILFLSVTAPTGTSEYETGEILKVDVRGRGFWTLGLGTQLVKNFSYWDVSFSGEIHRCLPRSVRPTGLTEDYSLAPGFGSNVGLGFGFRLWNSIRFGASLAHNFEESITAKGIVNSVFAPQTYWAVGATADYSMPDGWTLGLDYTDQTLLAARNVALSQSMVLRVQKNWGG